MTVPTRPLPDEDPNVFPEPGTDPGVPKEPGPAPGPAPGPTPGREEPPMVPQPGEDEN